MTRRLLLKSLIAIAGALALPAPVLARAGAAAPGPLPVRLCGLLRARASARRVGRAFLAGHPGQADAARLAALILGPDAPAAIGLDDRALALLVARRQAEDFAAGRTVVVEGWVLSRTEARLCALAAL